LWEFHIQPHSFVGFLLRLTKTTSIIYLMPPSIRFIFELNFPVIRLIAEDANFKIFTNKIPEANLAEKKIYRATDDKFKGSNHCERVFW